MSRIRSQLEAIRRNSEQRGGSRAASEEAPRPAYRSAPRHHETFAPDTDSAPVAQTAPSGNGNAGALQRIELLQREIADVKHRLTQIADREGGGEQRPHQADTASRFDDLAGELHQIREAVLALAEERQQTEPDAIARSIEEGYSRLTSHFNAMLEERTSSPDGEGALAALASQIGQVRDLVEGLPRHVPGDSLSARLEEIAQSVIRMDDENSLGRNFKAMEERLDEIARALVAISISPVDGGGANDGLDRVEARLASLARGLEELTARSNAAPADGGLSSPALDHIMAQLSDISSRIENSTPVTAPDPSQWVQPVMARLDEMGTRMDALGAAAPENDLRWRSVEEQIGAIAHHLEHQEQQGAQAMPAASDERLAALESALSTIAGRLQNISSQSVDFSPISGRLDSIEQMFAGTRDIAMEAASQAAERAVQMVGAATGDASRDEALATLSERLVGIEQQLAYSREMAMETAAQAAERAVQMVGAATGDAGRHEALATLAERLEGIEQQLALSREMAMETASQAAERAIAMTAPIHSQPQVNEASEAERQAVEQISQELQSLEAQSRDLASRNDESFESIRQALDSISSRLAGIEDEIRRATAAPEEPATYAPQPVAAPQPARQQAAAPRLVPMSAGPSLADMDAVMWSEDIAPGMETPVPPVPPVNAARQEPEIDDIPLEPGSGVPDLAALVRDASKRRKAGAEGDGEASAGAQDFLAAARRAAQAAVAQEASARNEASAAAENAGSSRFALPSFLKDRRKLLLGTAAAVVLIAAFIPLSARFGGSPAEAPQVVSEAAPQQPAEAADAPASAEETAEAADTPSVTASAEPAITPEVRPVDAQDLAAQGEQGVASAPLEQMPQTDAMEIPAVPEEIGNSVLKQAAAAGDQLALYEIARRYTDGDGVERNLEAAAQWYEVAARAGSAPAQYRLANFLEKGHGVKLDVEKSAMWYQRAAEQGNALAMHNLAVIYTSGLLGGKPDMESALGWFEKAADLGVKDSQVNLGIIFAKGIGVEADAVQAYKWLAIAARGGDTDAASKRDTLASAMRPEQLEKARGAAELWKPQPLDPQANVSEQKLEWKAGTGGNALLPGSALDAATATVTSEMIARVQAQLSQMGFDPGPADGRMGERTIDAVKAFQKEAGLPVDGQITTELLQKLDRQA